MDEPLLFPNHILTSTLWSKSQKCFESLINWKDAFLKLLHLGMVCPVLSISLQWAENLKLECLDKFKTTSNLRFSYFTFSYEVLLIEFLFNEVISYKVVLLEVILFVVPSFGVIPFKVLWFKVIWCKVN